MQRSHQHCAWSAELLLKRFISKVKERGNRKQIYLMGRGGSYHCYELNNQYTKIIDRKFLEMCASLRLYQCICILPYMLLDLDKLE